MFVRAVVRVGSIGILAGAACSSSVISSEGQGHAPPLCERCDDSGAASGPPPTDSGGKGGASPSTSAGDASPSMRTGGAPTATGGVTGRGGTSSESGGAQPGSGGAIVGSSDSGRAGRDGEAPRPAAIIPAVAVDCPVWASDVVQFMGLDGIRIEVGARTGSPVPMLIYWHSTGSTSDEYTKLAAPVATGITNAGGVIVSFQGTTGGDLYSGTSTFGKGDATLVDQLVACAVRDRDVDPSRIYTMGCSAGGFFAVAMGAMRSQYIAAVVSGSGGWVIDVPFANAHTPALMTTHPRPGATQPIDIAYTSGAADDAFTARGGFVIDCQRDARCDPSLATDAWTFLQAHPFGVAPEPWAAGLPAGYSSSCAIQ